MEGHVHISWVGVLAWMFTALIVLPPLHVLAIWLADTPFGQALAFSL